jgi:hypothetical protein
MPKKTSLKEQQKEPKNCNISLHQLSRLRFTSHETLYSYSYSTHTLHHLISKHTANLLSATCWLFIAAHCSYSGLCFRALVSCGLYRVEQPEPTLRDNIFALLPPLYSLEKCQHRPAEFFPLPLLHSTQYLHPLKSAPLSYLRPHQILPERFGFERDSSHALTNFQGQAARLLAVRIKRLQGGGRAGAELCNVMEEKGGASLALQE